jgi:hypothetical protein
MPKSFVNEVESVCISAVTLGGECWRQFSLRILPHFIYHKIFQLVPTFADGGCRVVSVIDPYDRILGFLDWSRYFFFQVAPQLYSRG